MVNGKNEKVADFFRSLVSMRTDGKHAPTNPPGQLTRSRLIEEGIAKS